MTYQAHPQHDDTLPARIKAIALQYPRWGWDGPVLWTKLIRVPFQGECTAVVAAWVAV